MFRLVIVLLLGFLLSFGKEAVFVQTEYKKPFKVVFEIYLDHPEKMRPAIGWISNVIFVLTNPPYNFSLEDIDIVVVSHGRELPVLLRENRNKYQDIVERIEGLTHYSVKFKVCRMALTQLYGATEKDLHPFVETVPSAIVEVAHWQMMGYSLIVPMVFEIRR